MKKRKDGLYCRQITVIENGVKKRKSFYARSEPALNRAIMSYKGEVAKGKFFKEVAEEWEEERFREIRYNTMRTYTPPLRDLIKKFGECRINSITPPMMQQFLAEQAVGKPSKGKVNLRLVIANQIFNFAILKGYTDANPASVCVIPKGLSNGRREPPSEEIIEKIKNNTIGISGMFAFFLLYTGVRRGEALAVTWKDIDFERKVIKINKQVVYQNSKPVISNHTKSEAGIREIILIDALARKLQELPRNSEYVFNFKGKLLTKQHQRSEWESYTKKLGIELTAHQLRHAYITILYEAGIDEKLAQYLAGHSSIAITRDIYTKIRLKKMREATEALNKFNP